MLLRKTLTTIITTITIMALLWLSVSIALAAPPDNDDFNAALSMGALPFNDTRDTREATVAEDDPFPFCGGRAATVWYAFTPTQDMRLEVNTAGSSYATSVSVYTGERGALNQLMCGENLVNVGLAANTSYIIMIGSLAGGPYPGPGNGGGDLVVSVQTIPAPTNDDFDNAVSISSLPFSDFHNTSGATVANDDPTPSCGGRDATVWYVFTPTENMRLEAGMFGSYSGAVAAFTGSRGSLVEVACGNTGPGQAPVQFDVTASETYYLMVGAGPGAPGGSLSFRLLQLPSPPPNDNINEAAPIASLPFSTALNTRGATRALDDPAPACIGPLNASVWFSFTASETMRIEADATGSNYGVSLAVYTGSPGALTEVFCSYSLTPPINFVIEGGQTYFFLVGTQNFVGGDLNLAVRRILPPANDDFDNAIEITGLPFTDSNRDTRAATTANDDPECYGQEVTVWYRFTPTQDARVEFSTLTSNYGNSLSVYTGERGNLVRLGCTATDALGPDPVLRLDLTANTTYYVMVGATSFGFPGVGGNLTLTMQALNVPGNDDFDNATAIGALPFTDSLDTRGASQASDDPFPDCGGRVFNVWYRFTAAEQMRVEANTFGSNYDTHLAVFTGARGNLTQLTCNGDAPGTFGGPSRVRFEAQPGQTYYFMVGGGGNFLPTGGDLTFNVNLAPLGPANDDFDSPTTIVSLPFNETLDTSGAIAAFDDPFPFCYGFRDATIWYAFTPTQTQQIEANTFGSNYNSTLSIYTGVRGALTQTACGHSQINFTAEANTTYYIMVASTSSSGGSLVFSMQGFEPPENDDFDNATAMASFPFSDSRNTRGATTAPDDPPTACGSPPDASVWYTLTPDQAVGLDLNSSGSDYGTTLSIFTGSRGALIPVVCSHSQVLLLLEANTTYFIMVASTSSLGGNLVLSAQTSLPSENDDFDNAAAIASFPFSDSRNTRGASTASDDPFPSCGGRDATVWYTFSVDHATQIEFNSSGINYSTGLSVYSGSRGALTEVACRDSLVRFTATPGTTYYLMVGSFQGTGGDLVLNGLELSPPTNDDVAGAVEIASLPFSDSNRDTRGATTATDDPTPSCTGSNGREASVWYAFTAPENLRIDANTFSSDYYATLAVYQGDPGSLVEIACGGSQVSFGAIANQRYLIMVGGALGGNLFLSAQGTPSPINDDFDSATIISTLPLSDTRDTRGATVVSDDPFPFCYGFREATVWYAFTIDQALRIDINSFGSDYGATFSVFTGSRGALNQIACGYSQVNFTAEANITYFIMVASTSNSGGSLVLSMQGFEPPANDDFDNATAIASLPFSDTRDTRGATVASDDPFPFCYGFREATVWYAFTLDQASGIDINTFGSDYNTTISVFTGSRGTLNQIACGFSQVNFTAEANTTYFIMVASTSSLGGNLLLSVQTILPPDNDGFDSAIVISNLPFEDNRDVRGATTAPDDPTSSCSGRNASVWYTLTPTEELRIEVNAFNSNYTAGLSVFTGEPGAFTEVACNVQQVRFNASPSATYYLMVDSPYGPSGQLALQVLGFQPPANDDFDNAAAIASFPFSDSLNTRGASTASDDPFCGGREATVWYTFSVDHATRIEFNTSGSNYSTGLSVYSGSRGALTEVVCRDSLVRFTATPGTTYYLMVGSLQSIGGDLVLNGLELSPPTNDDIGSAVEIASLPFSDSNRDTRGATTATDDPTPSCTGDNGREASVWYAFTAPENLRIDANTFSSDYYATLTVYQGDPGSLVEIACGGSQVIFGAIANQRYLIMVGGFPGGNLFLSVQGTPSPANDDFNSATLIASLPFSDTLDTSSATETPDDPFCSGRGSTVWYKFTPSENVTIEADTIGSNYDTTLSVYTGSRNALTQIVCNDDFFGGQSRVSFDAVAGETYHLMVGVYGSGRGANMVLSIRAILPAHFTVDSTTDAVDTNPGDGVCASGAGECTLRAAIMETNALPGNDVITLPGGTYQLTLSGTSEDNAFTGDLDITGNLTLNGAGANTTIVDAGGIDRVLHVVESISVNISDVTIKKGMVAGDRGGGIVNFGTLTLTNSTVSNNSASQNGFGGGIANLFGALTVVNSTFSGNSASQPGGGIANVGGTLIVTNSIFSGNSSPGGGGISNGSNSMLTVNNSTFSNNSASGGGAGIDNGGTLTVTNSTFSGNSAPNGAGISNFGTLAVTNSTFSGNSAGLGVGGGGGGVLNEGGGTVTLRNTIVANSPSGGNCVGTMTDGGGNLSWPDTTCPGLNADPRLGPLANNGGPTETHALLPGSAAINAAVNANCPATDQRGIARPIGPACDIGAFEADTPPPGQFTVNSTNDAVDVNPGNGVCASGAGECTLRAAIMEANALAGDDIITLPPGTYTLTRTGTDDTATKGDLDIRHPVTINGAGADLTIIRGRKRFTDRLFHILNTTAQFNGLTIRDGNPGASSGGGMRIQGGAVTLTNSAVMNNTTRNNGGGIYVNNSGTLTLVRSAVLNNTALGNGGGLYIYSGAATLANTTFSGNKANANGGGIRSSGASLTLNNVTLTNNTADNDAGGTAGNGGGLSRSSGTIHVKNSLIAGNFDRSVASSAKHADCSGAFVSQGYNLIGKNRGCSGFANRVNGDRVGTDARPINPRLAALADNGGPTFTHALLPRSPAINAGNPAAPGSGGNACEATDQRGVARPAGAACDIGAFEAGQWLP